MDLSAGDLAGPLALSVSNAGGSELVRKVAEYQPGTCERPGSSGADTAAGSGTR